MDVLASAVFPSACALCAAPLLHLSRAPICATCWLDLPPQSGPLCLCCGEALGAHAFAGADRAPGDWLCRPCRVAPPHFERAISPGLYDGTLRALLHLLKYQRVEPIAHTLGAHLAAVVAELPALPTALTVVPVPLYRAKQRQRGYNQAELLARALVRAGRARGLAWTLDTAHLRRLRPTVSQAGLNPRQRRDNMRGAFAVTGSAARHNARHAPPAGPLAGHDILLIDDIYTTGATARAASHALREGGVRSVWVATAARAQPLHALPLLHLPMEQDVAFWAAPAASSANPGLPAAPRQPPVRRRS